jgi:single-stranded DNA-specific DHH superfamily exonuclease
MNDPTKRSHGPTLLGAFLVGVIVVVLAVAIASLVSVGPVHDANLRDFNRNVAKVERFCGHERAVAFRATHDPDDNNEGPMQEWVKRCETGGTR